MPRAACNERLNDNVRPPPRTEGTAACELHVLSGKPRLGESADRQISGRPAGVGGDTDPVAGAARRAGPGVSRGGHPRARVSCLSPTSGASRSDTVHVIDILAA